MSYPIYRVESRERFETLLRADTRNEAINEFLPVNPDTADPGPAGRAGPRPDRCAG